MFRKALFILAFFATGAAAQNTGPANGEQACGGADGNDSAECAAAVPGGAEAIAAAEAQGVTGFVPLVAPALGAVAAAAGLAAAAGGGASPATTSTVSTN